MKIPERVYCKGFPCIDVNKNGYIVPGIEINPLNIRVIVISEAAPLEADDYYYANGDPLFERTTIQAFQDAGLKIKSIGELLDLGFYFTTAIKCGKKGYAIKIETINECSILLEEELSIFPNLQIIMLMGDVAIRAFNEVARRKTGKRVIPAGSTYKIRDNPYFYGGIRVFPSYLQAGPSFFIEKSKRRMIAEDIREVLKIVGILSKV